MSEHFYAHQQALVKNNVVKTVLAFINHDIDVMQSTFEKFTGSYDTIINLCDVQQEAYVDGAWTGTEFLMKPYASWIYNENTKMFDAPQICPDDGKFYYWDEDNQSWIEYSPTGSGEA